MRSGAILGVLCLIHCAAAAEVPDYSREARMAAEIVDTIMDGEAVMLRAGGREFLGIYTAAEIDRSRPAVIVLHGRGYHPDWEDVANPLRTGLSEMGYATLSLQMPVLPKGSTYYDYVPILEYSHPRILSGIEHLARRGHPRVVLAAHSCGAHMAMSFISSEGDGRLAGYVGIGMGATDYQQQLFGEFPLADMQVPILDIFGADEFPAVLRKAPKRWLDIRKGNNSLSRQIVIPMADHYFEDRGEALTDAVGTWLDSLP